MPWQVPGYRPREDLAGGTGRVVLATGESGELVVIKYFDTDSSRTSDDLRSAVNDALQLPNDYFVRIRELVQDSGHNAIVMDPVNGTTMRVLIRDDGAFEPESALMVFRDILAGLTHAHALDIVHGDVSPENVMINAAGRPIMLNVGAATWNSREPALSSGVYLAPERWRGDPPSAAADVYAATAMFVELLTGEPPYWEDIDLDRLRDRHVGEEIPLAEIPVALHDVVRAGMAKHASDRPAAGTLLDRVGTIANAEYGPDWAGNGRELVARRAGTLSESLPLGGATAIMSTDGARDTEDVANDDYYTDAAAVTTAASDIVELARMRAAAEAAAVRSAAVEEELTEEEEQAVAEVEDLLGLREPAAAETAAVEAIAAAEDTEPAEAIETTAEGAGDVAAPGAGADAAGRPEELVSAGAAGGAARRAGSSVATARSPERAGFYRRHPWWSSASAAAFVAIIIGLTFWVGAGRPGANANPANTSAQPAVSTTRALPTTAPATAAGGGGATAPGVGPSTPASVPATSGTVTPSGHPSTPPTLPVTGMLHPIRLMAAIAFGLVSAGALLMYAGRRRDGAPAT